MKLEDSLNGGYGGLYGEVVTEDIYGLKELPFVPDIVFDLGGNVGIFARFAQSLWPEAEIYSVEPHPSNIEVYKEHTQGTNLIEAAIGKGKVWHYTGAANGAHENYISEGVGFDGKVVKNNPRAEVADVPTITVFELVDSITRLWKIAAWEFDQADREPKTILKMDIEGGENIVFADEKDMEALARIDYLTFEIHNFGETADGSQAVKELTQNALESFAGTHRTWFEHPHFWALKKGL